MNNNNFSFMPFNGCVERGYNRAGASKATGASGVDELIKNSINPFALFAVPAQQKFSPLT